jgi:hypothetical protein
VLISGFARQFHGPQVKPDFAPLGLPIQRISLRIPV